jgi:intein-encoded DNA endonuclease-like protein
MPKEIVKKIIESYKMEILKFGKDYKILVFGYPHKAFSIEDIIKEIEENPTSDLAKLFIRSRYEYLKWKGEI